MTAGQGRLSFLQGFDPGEATCALVDGSTPVLLQVALSRLSVFFFKRKRYEVGRESCKGGCVEGKGMGSGLDQNHVWIHSESLSQMKKYICV